MAAFDSGRAGSCEWPAVCASTCVCEWSCGCECVRHVNGRGYATEPAHARPGADASANATRWLPTPRRIRSARALFCMHTELRRRHAGPQHALRRHAAVLDRKTAEGRAQVVERQPEVEQRTDHHVARQAGETIEIQRLAHASGLSSPFAPRLSGGASRLDGVAPLSNTQGILGRRALPAGRRAPKSTAQLARTGH